MMSKKKQREKKNLLVFGYGFSLIFFVVGIRLWLKYGFSIDKALWLGTGGLWLVVTIVNYEWLRPVYRGWMKVSGGIGTIVSAVILAVLFYGVFSPVGIILRLMGRDVLDRRIEKRRLTYWNRRPLDQRGEERYRQQF